MKLNKIVLFSTIYASTVFASASWIRVDDSDLFYDEKSITTNGQLTTVTVRSVKIGSQLATFEIDCRKKSLITSTQEITPPQGSPMFDLIPKVCSSGWKFWK